MIQIRKFFFGRRKATTWHFKDYDFSDWLAQLCSSLFARTSGYIYHFNRHTLERRHECMLTLQRGRAGIFRIPFCNPSLSPGILLKSIGRIENWRLRKFRNFYNSYSKNLNKISHSRLHNEFFVEFTKYIFDFCFRTEGRACCCLSIWKFVGLWLLFINTVSSRANILNCHLMQFN